MDSFNSGAKHLPVYNIKAVARLLGLQPVTLRAWERRYGLPVPHRGGQGYRLYSEYDLLTLRWLKNQIETGMSIGRAVNLLTEMRDSGHDPAMEETSITVAQPVSLQNLSDDFYQAILRLDDGSASATLRRAFSIYNVDQVLINVIQPVLVELGEAWHRGDIPIAIEHYATHFCMQHLLSMLAASAPPAHSGLIFAACAPGEQHQIGLLSLIVMLRWRGWDVKYFGADLSLERIDETLRSLHPRMILFTSTRYETAHSLIKLPELVNQLPEPPIVVLGGNGFHSISPKEVLPGIYIDSSPTETVLTIERLMKTGIEGNL
jgi:MerR family transcriptional regulator, light-induced transcriptional regulator